MKKINLHRFHPTPECRQMMGSAAAIAPKASQDALQNVTPLLLGGILHNIGIPVDCNTLPNICPSRNSYKNMVKDVAKDTILCNISKMKKAVFIYLIADKANSDKRGGTEATFPKLFAFYNPEKNKVEEFLIDCDSAGNSSDEAARAIKHSLEKLGYADGEIFLVGGTTDSGGGGTKESLKEALRKLGVVTKDYRVNTCALHNIQTCLTTSELEAMWNHACEDLDSTTDLNLNIKKFCHLTNPVLTRWWLVGVTAKSHVHARN